MIAAGVCIGALTGSADAVGLSTDSARAATRFVACQYEAEDRNVMGHDVWFDVVLIRSLGLLGAFTGEWRHFETAEQLLTRVQKESLRSSLVVSARIEAGALQELHRRRAPWQDWL
jgi:hypothetical protein